MLGHDSTQMHKKNTDALVLLFKVTLYLIPLFFLTIREWTHITAGLAIILACVLLCRIDLRPYPTHTKWLVALVSLPLLSVFVSQLLRNDWIASAYDAPSRLIFALPLGAVIFQARINFTKLLQASLVAAILCLVLYAIFFPHYNDASSIELRRLTSPFIDAIFFGFWAMLMACLMLAFALSNLRHQKLGLSSLYVVLGCMAWYLSFLSKTRTGWVALPFLTLAGALYIKPQLNLKDILYALGLSAMVGVCIYFSVHPVQSRLNLLWQEITLYSQGEAIDTSIGLRIQMWRLGLALFWEHPFLGYGDGGYNHLLSNPEFKSLASPAAQAMALMAGFHNEFISHAVRSGLAGLLAISLVLLAPLFFFGKILKSASSAAARESALIGMVMLICVLFASLSNEMLNYKFSISFFAYLYVCLWSDLYWKSDEAQ